MGWVAGSGNSETEKFPVDKLVETLENQLLQQTDSFCKDYAGQVRKCCDGIRICFTTLGDSLTTVKLQAVGDQDMYRACRDISSAIAATRSCVRTWSAQCHWNVDQDLVTAPFSKSLDEAETTLADRCNKLPPERTTVTVYTTVPTTKTTVLVTTLKYSRTEVIAATERHVVTSQKNTTPLQIRHTTQSMNFSSTQSSNTTSSGTPGITSVTPSTIVTNQTADFPGNRSDWSSQNGKHGGAGLNSDATIAVVASVIGGLLLLAVLVLFIFIRYRKRKSENSESGGSLEPREKLSFFSRLFNNRKRSGSKTDTEIYAEIDDNFMEAVYRHDKEKHVHPGSRDRPTSSTQVNICYVSPFTDDSIIRSEIKSKGFAISPKSSAVKTGNSSKTKPEAHENNYIGEHIYPAAQLNALNLIRKGKDVITSFQKDQLSPSRQVGKYHSAYQNEDNKMIHRRKSFITSRPGFTHVRSDELTDADNVDVEAREISDDVFADELFHEVPTYGDSDYDTAQYGRNPRMNIRQVPENEYNSFPMNVYKNVGRVSPYRCVISKNSREYNRGSSDIDTCYDTIETMMEY